MSSFAIAPVAPPNVTQSQATARTGPAAPQPAPEPAPTPAQSQDTVKLSTSAQAEAMYRAGESISSISASLGVSTSVVDSYLDITQAVSTPTTVAVHGGGAPSSGSTAYSAPPAAAKPAATTVDVKA